MTNTNKLHRRQEKKFTNGWSINEKIFKHWQSRNEKIKQDIIFHLSNLMWGQMEIRCLEGEALFSNSHLLPSFPHVPFNYFHLVFTFHF